MLLCPVGFTESGCLSQGKDTLVSALLGPIQVTLGHMIKLLSRLFWALVGLYGTGTSLFLITRRLISDVAFPPYGFLNSFAHLLMLPALIFLPAAGIWRRKWIAAGLTLPALEFLLTYGGLFLRREPDGTGTGLNLLTYNTHAESESVQAMVEIIRSWDADLVCIQELSLVLAAEIESQLSAQYPYRALYPTDSTDGLGILSKYPIRAQEYWKFPDIPSSLGHLRTEIETPRGILALYSAHPVHPGMVGRLFDPEPRAREIGHLLERFAKEPGMIIVAGDFNLSDQSSDYQRLTGFFQDAYREVGRGLGLTYPDWKMPQAKIRPYPGLEFVPLLVRLDYVFYRAPLRAIKAVVNDSSGGSDHHPVWVQFGW